MRPDAAAAAPARCTESFAEQWYVRALGGRAVVRSTASEVSARLDAVLSPLRDDAPPAADEPLLAVDAGDDGGFLLRTPSGTHELLDAGAVVDKVQWTLNAWVIEALHRRGTGLHAAAARQGDVTVVLPAVTEAGKSTLVTGLVQAGWTYLTDEAVELANGRVRGYAKAVTLDPGSQHLFPGLRPRYEDTASWYVPLVAAGDSSHDTWCAATHVVLPRWAPGCPPEAVRLGGAEAVMALARCTFYFNSSGSRNLAALAHLVRSVPIWQITYPDLPAGVRLVQEVSARSGGPARCASGQAASVAGIAVERFDDGAVAYLEQRGSLHLLDRQAEGLWSRLQHAELGAVLAELGGQVPAREVATARRDVKALHRRFVAEGLLPG